MNLSVHEKYYKFCPNCKTDLQRKIIDGKERFFCPSCDFIFWNNPKPVVSMLLQHNNELLMLKRATEPLKGYWCLPGGYINYEETPEQAIKREVKEEIGVEVSIECLIGVYQIDNDPRGINIDIIYEGKLEGDVHLSDEHSKFKFVSFEKLPDNIAYKHREAINDWLNRRKKYG